MRGPGPLGSDTRNQQHQPPEKAQHNERAPAQRSTAPHRAERTGNTQHDTPEHTQQTRSGKKQTTGAGNDANKRQSTTAHDHTTAQRNRTKHSAAEHQDTPRRTTGRRATWPDNDSTAKHDTKTHQETGEDSQAQQRTPSNTSQRTVSNDRDSTTEARARPTAKDTQTRPAPHNRQKKKTEKGKTRNKGKKKRVGCRGPGQPESEKRQRQQGGGAKKKGKKKGGGQDAKAQGTRGWKTRKAGHNDGATGGGGGEKGNKKKTNNNHKQGNPSPEGAEQAKSEPRTAIGKVRRTRTRPGGRPAPPGQAGHAQAHTRGTRAWRPPTRKGRCRRPHQTAPVHRPSPPLQDGRYRKPDASVTGSTHAKPPQRTQPKTEAGGTRQGQPHRGAPNGYDAERAQRPCLGRGQRQAHEPGSRPASTCPAQPPSKARGDSPRGGGRHHGDGKADRSTESGPTGRGAAHQRGATKHAREARRRPQPRHEDRCQATTATGCREPGKRAQHTTKRGTGQGAKDSGVGGSGGGATTKGARRRRKKARKHQSRKRQQRQQRE